jgi:hypothetical protein
MARKFLFATPTGQNSQRAVDLVGPVQSDGTISAEASYADLHASMNAKLDPDRHALSGTVDSSNGCVYQMTLEA